MTKGASLPTHTHTHILSSMSVRGGSKEEGWRRRSQEIGNGLRMERPRSPCEVRENLRQVGRVQDEVRKPKCQRKED